MQQNKYSQLEPVSIKIKVFVVSLITIELIDYFLTWNALWIIFISLAVLFLKFL